MSRRIAVVVGIDDYESAPLNCCVSDSAEFAACIQLEEYGFTAHLITNLSATRRNIIQTLEAAADTDPEILIFYFSGHGCTTDTGTYLVTIDGERYDEGLEVGLIGRLLTKYSNSGITTVAIIDCCHSGASSPWVNYASPMRRSDIEREIPASGISRAVLAACRPEEFSYEDESLGHGIFTHHLLEGLMGEAVDYDGNITINSLYDHVSRPFERIVGQTPVFRVDLAGRLVIGSGFPPRLGRPVKGDALKELEIDARKLIDAYDSRPVLDFEARRQYGYQDACSALEPIAHWFRSRVAENPDLARRPVFADLNDAVWSRVQHLGSVDPGTRVREGVLTKRLGDGSFGVVWKVEAEERNSPPLAYKIYHPHELTLSDKVNRFARGYRAMQQLDHARIVRVHRYTGCPVGFFMDYIDGPNLRGLSRGIGEPSDAVELLLAVAETLRHAHGRGVVHRDIKPENIVVRYDPDAAKWLPFLTDFDLAWFSAATRLTQEGMGNAFYAAPEQFSTPNAKAARSELVDVYAFGQLAFFTLTGTDPVPLGTADNSKVVRRYVESWNSERAAHLFFKFYDRCSRAHPSDRYQNFHEIVGVLSEIFQHLETATSDQRLKPEEFINSLIFSFAGLNSSRSNTRRNGFVSLSGRTQVAVTFLGTKYKGETEVIEIEANMITASGLTITGVNHDEARRLLNTRVDAALRGFTDAHRRSGNRGGYDVFVRIVDIQLDVGGVARCRDIISRAVDAIERA